MKAKIIIAIVAVGSCELFIIVIVIGYITINPTITAVLFVNMVAAIWGVSCIGCYEEEEVIVYE